MRDTLAFEYFEVRPCIERDRRVTSYRDEDEFTAELTRAQKSGREFRAFWSLYGVDRSCTMAIGDFVSKDAAHEVMSAILAVSGLDRRIVERHPAQRGHEDGGTLGSGICAHRGRTLGIEFHPGRPSRCPTEARLPGQHTCYPARL